MTVKLYLDPAESRKNKRIRAYRLNALAIPILRMLGFGILSIALMVHNHIIYKTVDIAGLEMSLIIILCTTYRYYI